MEVGERNHALTLRSAHADRGLECGESDAHVGRMGGDALFAGPEDGVVAIDAFEGAAAAAGIAFVTGREGRVHEVRAARALQEIAAVSGEVAKLRRRAGEDGAGEQRILLADQRDDWRYRCCAREHRVAIRHWAAASICANGRRLMSTRRSGSSTPFFIRSIRLVPPARNFAGAPLAIASTAARAEGHGDK